VAIVKGMNLLILAFVVLAGTALPAARAADVSELTPADMFRQGVAAYSRGDYNAAATFLSARARHKPEDATVFYYLGNCYLHGKQYKQAAHMFAACVRISPSSQAGRYALSALESLSASSAADQAGGGTEGAAQDPAHLAAAKDALMSEKAVDKSFNEAVERIKSQRHTLKAKIDRIWADMQDDILSMGSKTAANAAELEAIKREAENKVQHEQTRELRFEHRVLGPDKIDVRPIPQLPAEKPDDSKAALGSLLEYFKTEQPFDPLAADVTPEATARFLTINDLFGELKTYQPSARRLAKQVFFQLKSGIEGKQDILDQDIYQLKANLIRDLVQINSTYGGLTYSKGKINPASFIIGAKIPRSEDSNLTAAEVEMSQAVLRAKRRIQQLMEDYHKDVESLIAGAKERVHGTVAQSGQMNKQLRHPSGNIQLVPLGTDLYIRNYVNFGERPELDPPARPMPVEKGTAGARAQPKQVNQSAGTKTGGPARSGAK
jgi:tetratricopeptide (TPR) repeat protein